MRRTVRVAGPRPQARDFATSEDPETVEYIFRKLREVSENPKIRKIFSDGRGGKPPTPGLWPGARLKIFFGFSDFRTPHTLSETSIPHCSDLRFLQCPWRGATPPPSEEFFRIFGFSESCTVSEDATTASSDFRIPGRGGGN